MAQFKKDKSSLIQNDPNDYDDEIEGQSDDQLDIKVDLDK